MDGYNAGLLQVGSFSQYSETILKCSTFRKQTEEIKMQLQTCRREKQTVDGLYSNSEKEMAK